MPTKCEIPSGESKREGADHGVYTLKIRLIMTHSIAPLLLPLSLVGFISPMKSRERSREGVEKGYK